MSSVKFDNNRKEVFALIDSNALIHRAYHAYPATITTSKGDQVNAVYGFTSMLFRVLEEINPKYIACAFDLPKPTFRHLEYVGYKAARKKPDQEMLPQFDHVRRVVKALNIPMFQVEGFEADDVIGTLCRQIDELDPKNQVDTIIVTGDKDALQLVDANTKVWLPGRTFKDMQLYGEDRVFERYGLKPKQIIDLKALAGDPSDQIPGVKGIGEKGATTLLQEFGTVEGIYENLSCVSTRYRKLLEKERESAFLSKNLATIVTSVPIKLNFEESVLEDYDYDDAFNLLQEFEFRSLIKRLPKSSRENNTKDQFGLFSNNGEKDESKDAKTGFKYKEVKDDDSLSAMVKDLKKAKLVSLYLHEEEEKSVGLALSYGKETAYIPFDFLSSSSEMDELQKALLKPEIVGYNLKSVIKAFDPISLELGKYLFDTRIVAYLLGAKGGQLELPALAFAHCGMVLDESKKELVTDEKACMRSSAILQLRDKLEEKLSVKDKKAGEVWRKMVKGEFEKLLSLPDYEIGVKDLFYKVEMPLVPILAEMEMTGIEVDENHLQELGDELGKQIQNEEKGIYELIGHEFNIASSRQLADVLFEELHLPVKKKTKAGYSTAASVLEELRDAHPVISHIETYRELTKLKSTYIDGLLPLIEEDERIHTTYNQTVAITGRLSSSRPNLQNIPIRTDIGNEIRKAFVSSREGVLVAIDYSQIELRIAAHVAGDEKMLNAFHNGEDVHAVTASEIFDIPLEKVSKSQRRIAKTVNFAVLYGVSAFGLSQQLGKTPKESAEIIELYFDKYPDIKNYVEKAIEMAREYGYLESIFGRVVRVGNISSSNAQVRNAAERFSINYPMQSSAADIMKISMIEVEKQLMEFRTAHPEVYINSLLQVHDELVFEYAEKGVAHKLLFDKGCVKSKVLLEFVRLMKDTMGGVIKLSVPLSVEVEIGRNWGEMEGVEL